MARISGVDLPPNKRVAYGLTAIYGIGLHTAQKIIASVGIDQSKKIKDLSDEEVTKIRKLLEVDYKVEGALRAEIAADVKRLIDIGSYRGTRHKVGLPAPDTDWQPGEFVRDEYRLKIPTDLPTEKYFVQTGFYYLPTGERLGEPEVIGQVILER